MSLEQIATLAFRIIGVCTIVFVLPPLLVTLVGGGISMLALLAFAAFAATGFVLLRYSKQFAAYVCKDL